MCVPIYCQDNPANPYLLEWRNLTTGDCIDKCTTSGYEWFSRYKSCRPSSCPHGRYSNGNCRPAPPPPPTTTTVPARWSATCSYSFPKGEPVSATLPTHNKADGYTLRGILPPGVSATPKTGGSYTLAGTPTAGGDWTATLGATLTSGGTATLDCAFAVPAPPDKPTEGLAANGDSRGVDDKTGQSVVEWDPVVGATKYAVRHKRPADSAWTGPVSTTGLTRTLGDLDLDSLYSVTVRAVNDYGSSASSDVFTFPTRLPYPKRLTAPLTFAGLKEVVGIIPILGYRAGFASSVDGTYTYKICDDSLSDDDSTAQVQERQIRAGIEVWQSATGLVTSHHSVGSCGGGRLNHIYLSDAVELKRFCKVEDASGSACVISHPGPLSTASGAFLISRIYIDQDAGTEPLNSLTTTLPGSCSQLFRIAMHEAGHVFGLYHPKTDPNKSVMYMPADSLCGLTAYDVVAIQAIYQSR